LSRQTLLLVAQLVSGQQLYVHYIKSWPNNQQGTTPQTHSHTQFGKAIKTICCGCPVLLFVVLLPVLCCFVVVAPSWLTQVTYKDFNALSSYQLVRTEGQKAKRNEKEKLD